VLNRVIQGKVITKIKLASQSYLKNSILSYRVPVVPEVPKVPVVPTVIPVPDVRTATKVFATVPADTRAEFAAALAVVI
jgi:hypothetical protein